MPIDVALPSYKSLKWAMSNYLLEYLCFFFLSRQDIESASVKYDFFMLLLKCQRVSAAKESTRSEEIFVNSEDEFWFQVRSFFYLCFILSDLLLFQPSRHYLNLEKLSLTAMVV